MNTTRWYLAFAFSFVLSAAGAPPAPSTAGIEVLVVKDAGGSAVFKGKTGSGGSFATGTLEAGTYIVQFTSGSSALKGNQYSIAAVGGQKAVTASAVPGEKFGGGGVAMKVAVAANSKLTGQVVAGATAAVENVGAAKREGKARAQAANTDSFRRIQDLSGQGAATNTSEAKPSGR